MVNSEDDTEGGDWYDDSEMIGDRVAREEPRQCTVCLARGVRIHATHVAAAAGGLEWFECGQHEPADNIAGSTRVKLTPIREWFASHGLPLPGSTPG